jgi:hypothetical protein
MWKLQTHFDWVCSWKKMIDLISTSLAPVSIIFKNNIVLKSMIWKYLKNITKHNHVKRSNNQLVCKRVSITNVASIRTDHHVHPCSPTRLYSVICWMLHTNILKVEYLKPKIVRFQIKGMGRELTGPYRLLLTHTLAPTQLIFNFNKIKYCLPKTTYTPMYILFSSMLQYAHSIHHYYEQL